jgi:hypothetical protein
VGGISSTSNVIYENVTVNFVFMVSSDRINPYLRSMYIFSFTYASRDDSAFITKYQHASLDKLRCCIRKYTQLLTSGM